MVSMFSKATAEILSRGPRFARAGATAVRSLSGQHTGQKPGLGATLFAQGPAVALPAAALGYSTIRSLSLSPEELVARRALRDPVDEGRKSPLKKDQYVNDAANRLVDAVMEISNKVHKESGEGRSYVRDCEQEKRIDNFIKNEKTFLGKYRSTLSNDQIFSTDYDYPNIKEAMFKKARKMLKKKELEPGLNQIAHTILESVDNAIEMKACRMGG